MNMSKFLSLNSIIQKSLRIMEEILIKCSPGVSGDMLLGAFYDLGVPKNIIEKTLARIGLENLYNLNFKESKSCSIREPKLKLGKLIKALKEIGEILKI